MRKDRKYLESVGALPPRDPLWIEGGSFSAKFEQVAREISSKKRLEDMIEKDRQEDIRLREETARILAHIVEERLMRIDETIKSVRQSVAARRAKTIEETLRKKGRRY